VRTRREFLGGAAASTLLLPAFLAGCGGQSKNFGIGVIPYEEPRKEKEEYVGFGDFVGTRIDGKPANVFIASDYVGVISALEADQIDAAYLNPLGYVIASNRARKAGHPLIPIAMPYVIYQGKGDLTYEGVIFTRKDSGVKSLADLKGKSVAFNEPTSTSGYLYPVAMLLKAGVNPKPAPEGDLKQVFFAGAQGVVPAVLHKQAAAGAIFEQGIELSLPDPADRAKLKILARTDPIPNGMLVARGTLDPAAVEKLKQAMREINSDPMGKLYLKKMGVEKWVPPQDNLFDPVRKAAAILKLDLPTSAQRAAATAKSKG